MSQENAMSRKETDTRDIWWEGAIPSSVSGSRRDLETGEIRIVAETDPLAAALLGSLRPTPSKTSSGR